MLYWSWFNFKRWITSRRNKMIEIQTVKSSKAITIIWLITFIIAAGILSCGNC